MVRWLGYGLAAGALALQVAVASSQSAPRFPSKIVSVTAKLYYSNSGTFSENILDKPDLGLWNTIIGEGQAGGPSEATLIEVEVNGDGGGNVIHKEQLAITIRQKGKPAITRHPHVYLDQNGKYYAAMWLYDSGCLPVTITAQLERQPPIRKKIDFECGE